MMIKTQKDVQRQTERGGDKEEMEQRELDEARLSMYVCMC